MKRKHETKTRIKTVWEIWTYDVWGNARDGFEVNDRSRIGKTELFLDVEINNPGTPHEFNSAFPSNAQIRRAFGLRPYRLDVDGDDVTVYVNRERDGYPIGEMYCVSHESLSPIRPRTETPAAVNETNAPAAGA